MNTKKISNIIFILTGVVLGGAFLLGSMRMVKNTVFITNMIQPNNTNKDAEHKEDENLQEPLVDTETTNNVGTRNEQKEQIKLEILNFEVLDKYISNDSGEFDEIYYGVYDKLRDKFSTDISCYIEEGSIVVEDEYISFSLFNVNTKSLIDNFRIKYKDKFVKSDEPIISRLIIENDKAVLKHMPEGGESVLYLYDSIIQELKFEHENVKKCYIDINSIEKNGNSITFDVFDSSSKKKLKSIKLIV